jgi:hypothetical protein
VYADDIKVKEGWFVPHFAAREDRAIEVAMVREWKDYMSYEDSFDEGWSTRLAASILAPIPGGQNERTARVAATFALWCVMPVGRGFFEPVLRKIREQRETSISCRDTAIAAWAVENQLGLRTDNRLEALLYDSKGRPVYKHKPYPTLPDHRSVELTLGFLVSEEGRAFLKRVCNASSSMDWLPL